MSPRRGGTRCCCRRPTHPPPPRSNFRCPAAVAAAEQRQGGSQSPAALPPARQPITGRRCTALPRPSRPGGGGGAGPGRGVVPGMVPSWGRRARAGEPLASLRLFPQRLLDGAVPARAGSQPGPGPSRRLPAGGRGGCLVLGGGRARLGKSSGNFTPRGLSARWGSGGGCWLCPLAPGVVGSGGRWDRPRCRPSASAPSPEVVWNCSSTPVPWPNSAPFLPPLLWEEITGFAQVGLLPPESTPEVLALQNLRLVLCHHTFYSRDFCLFIEPDKIFFFSCWNWMNVGEKIYTLIPVFKLIWM